MDDKRGLWAVVIVAIILFLLLARGRTSTTIVNKSDVPPLAITVDNPIYNLPTLPPIGSGAWDWMQSTDLGCGCDAGQWKAPIYIAPVLPEVFSYPVYNYVVNTQYVPVPGSGNNFAVYTPPPPPEWWYEWGTNVKGEINRQYIVTSLGTTLIGGKYSRKPDQWGGYGDQTKYGWTQTGPDVYYGGKHFVHNPARDYPHPKQAELPRGLSFASYG